MKLSRIMTRARHYLPLKILQTIYHALVYPYLTYCNIVRTRTYPTRLESIYNIQRKIVRIGTFSKFTQEMRPTFLSLNLLTIYELNSYLSALFMYSYFTEQTTPSFSDYFLKINTIHSYNTRSAKKSIH